MSVNEFKAIEERINQDKETARLIGQGLNTVMPIFMLLAIGGGAMRCGSWLKVLEERTRRFLAL